MSKEDKDPSSDPLSYILIRRGTSLQDVEKIPQPSSVESKIARGRGGGELTKEPTHTDNETAGGESTNTENTIDHSGKVEFNEGRLRSETSYFMHFIPPEHKILSVYDIISLPENTSYPVNKRSLSSLPNWALSQLRDQGHIKIRAKYDSEGGIFNYVHEGWSTESNPFDRILEIADELDGDIMHAVYYLTNKYGSSELGNPENIAELRNIKPSTVEDAISKVESEIAQAESASENK